MTTMWSESDSASCWSCVTKIAVKPRRACSSCSSVRMRSRRLASRLESGSSSSTTRGSCTSARASATRCCWPPLRSDAGRSCRSPSPTSSRIARVRSCACRFGTPAMVSGNDTLPPTRHVRPDRVGLEHHADVAALRLDEHAGRRRRPTWSPTVMRPAVGTSSPAMQRSVVVLPQPLGPSSVTVLPGATTKSMPRTARDVAEDL